MKHHVLLTTLGCGVALLATGCAAAGEDPPGAGVEAASRPPAVVLELWPDAVPGQATGGVGRLLPARGDGVTRLTDIGCPTLEIYPVEEAGGLAPAVLILPGGGYSILAHDKEGTEVAAWLNRRNIAAAVLRYRVPDNRAGAFQDAQRAMGLLRHHAASWGIDPERLGVIGFSAGGHLAVRLCTAFAVRAYARVDAADDLSCRPDFATLLYPAYLAGKGHELVAEVVVTDQTPPAFLVATQDDTRWVPSSIAYYLALAKAGVAAEIHLFPAGGHGYGLRPSAHTVSGWPELWGAWLATRTTAVPETDGEQ